MAQFVSGYIKYDSNNNETLPDWQDFLKAVTNYNSDDLSFDLYRDNAINQSNSTAREVVARIVSFLLDVISVPLDDAGTRGLTATIEAALEDLRSSKNSGWADVSEQGSEKSPCEYRLLVSIANPDLPESFYALVTTIGFVTNKVEYEYTTNLTGSYLQLAGRYLGRGVVVELGFRLPQGLLRSHHCDAIGG